MMFSPGTEWKFPSAQRISALQGLFQLLMLCHASGMSGQKLPLPVAHRILAAFPSAPGQSSR